MLQLVFTHGHFFGFWTSGSSNLPPEKRRIARLRRSWPERIFTCKALESTHRFVLGSVLRFFSWVHSKGNANERVCLLLKGCACCSQAPKEVDPFFQMELQWRFGEKNLLPGDRRRVVGSLQVASPQLAIPFLRLSLTSFC